MAASAGKVSDMIEDIKGDSRKNNAAAARIFYLPFRHRV
jgi:hypothetical protein